jgi:murein DD-endopeptidase MepM/ murein hydrolase activator NlpD
MWTFYRLPFYPGYSLWSMGQGNNGGFTHTGKSAYAFDFVAPIPSEIRAARGGIVVDLREYQTGNKYDVSVLFPNDTLLNQYCDVAKCHENWLLIRHEDGKETWYGHMIPNGVLPQKGQKVFRGEPIAYVGNTGYSTRPHLHFQQQDTTGYSLSSCFEATAPFASSLLIPCYIPKKGNLLFSNNQ